MNFLNVDIPVKNVPELDKGFVPLGLFFKNYQKGAAKPLCIAVERSGGQIGTYETKIYGTPEMEQADAYYVDRLVKFLLWSWGGFKAVSYTHLDVYKRQDVLSVKVTDLIEYDETLEYTTEEVESDQYNKGVRFISQRGRDGTQHVEMCIRDSRFRAARCMIFYTLSIFTSDYFN